MISLDIPGVKEFMAHLFTSENFDGFLLKELYIKTFTGFKIIDDFNEEFFDNEELEVREEKQVYWRDTRDIAFYIIKGKRPPHTIKIVFSLAKKNVRKMLERFGGKLQEDDVAGLYITVNYKEDKINIITGTAMNLFTLDKSLEREWDTMIKAFLKQNKIAFLEN